ncbi:MAG: hypothetical protein GQ475_06070 [Methylococcaceae bacterium]|nr:hypothetical protein [Methylococcaceae bacterium]
MHACELGAVGIYQGHKCVACYFFRANLSDLDNMRFQEKGPCVYFQGFAKRAKRSVLFCASIVFVGGLFYGVIVGLFGLKAIGTNTYTIKNSK